MTLLTRLFGRAGDPREEVRPLWHRVVEIARERAWYLDGGVADTVAGRFDMITLVLALVLLRMEREPALAAPCAHLTELFVDDMDAQLREGGVGDPTVGKHIGRLVSVLGGRLGALRAALAQPDDAALASAVERNVSFAGHGDPATVAARLRALALTLEALPTGVLLAAEIAR